jgi:hypothetical protein
MQTQRADALLDHIVSALLHSTKWLVQCGIAGMKAGNIDVGLSWEGGR